MEIKPEEIVRAKLDPLELFRQGIKSDATRIDYTHKLKKIVCEFYKQILKGDPEMIREAEIEGTHKPQYKKVNFCDADFEVRVNEFVKRSKNDPEWAEDVVLSLVRKLKDRTKLDPKNPDYLRVISMNNYIRPIQKLFKMNEITISWERIKSTYPEEDEKIESREYTYDEIKKMLKGCNGTMDRVMVLMACSSGIRAGALTLQWKHVKPIYLYKDCFCWEDQEVTESVEREGKIVGGIIRIYAKSSSEYFGFITPECWNEIEVYKTKWIQRIGTEPKPEDPFFKRVSRLQEVRELKPQSIRRRMLKIAIQSGLRKPLPKGVRRHDVPLFNGFRRFFNKANKKALSKGSMLASLILKENMMGHSGLIKLDKNYFKSHVSELIEEYLLAVPNLSISDEERQKQIIKRQEQKITELERKELRVQELEENQQRILRKLDKMQRVVPFENETELEKLRELIKEESQKKTSRISNRTHS